ncbi:hypothetical protein [Clostridium saccharobutylicum]|nr:hypothetical protein [Clostridium saccharobutylicum]MBA9009549.1 hypothetical protein [Clostridium saccharobutylicum]
MITTTINDNTPLAKEAIKSLYKNIGKNGVINDGYYIISKNDQTEYWYEFADINLTKDYSKIIAKFYFEDNVPSLFSSKKGYVSAEISYTNSLAVNAIIDSNSTLDKNNFGFSIEGNLVRLFVRVQQDYSYIFKLVDCNKKDLVKLKYFNATNQKTNNTKIPTTYFSKTDLSKGYNFETLTYSGSMTNGLLEVNLALPYEFSFLAYTGVNVSIVNSGNTSDVSANVTAVDNNNIKINAKHTTGTGDWFCSFKILVYGVRK